MPENQHTLHGKVVAVTGAGRGLGRAYAIALAARGAAVVVNDLPATGGDEPPAEQAAEQIRREGGDAMAFNDSVATEDGAQSLVEAAMTRYGRIDTLVNNAGVLRDKTIANMTMELLSPVLDVNLTAAFHTIKAVWPFMKEQGSGRIINTTSASGLFGNFGQSNYAAAKMGVVGLTRVAALEGKRHAIAVNAVAPVAATALTGPDPTRAALKRPEQVAPLIVALATAPTAVTGQVFLAGGGWFTRCAVVHGEGWHGTGEVTAEQLTANWDAITDLSKSSAPASAQDIAAEMQRRWDSPPQPSVSPVLTP